MFSDCVIILLASFTSALLAEGLSWLLVYRTSSYKELKTKIERLQAKLEKLKDQQKDIVSKKNKKIDRLQEQLSTAERELTFSKMKSIFAVGITLVSIFGVLNSHFGGRVIAMLPFEPFPLVRNVSHGGLLGDDYYECSMAFIYALCSISIRANLQKFFGFAPPKTKSSGIFGAPPEQS
eukprot:TRINITY_DN9894_c0_g1_i2.p1 TRINITY_DN9894_c0_g1~~TRINITY_DN9894_c0_g1_i2.p1  ORF type:complete len:179 (-),score=25.35 TRINITY_DN9894_c0_g1_i2:274-810(-)